jgi:hypothetical protein
MQTTYGIEIDYPVRPLKSTDPEYQDRISKRLPVRPPRFLPGDLVYDTVARANKPVVRVEWDRGGAYQIPYWRVSVPGLSASETLFQSPRDDRKTQQFQQVDCCTWKDV